MPQLPPAAAELTRGGVAPSMACGASNMAQKQIVKYQADYIFYRAM